MIEVICGPMFSGKSEELIRRLVRAEIAGKKVKAYKPWIDTRTKKEIASLSGSHFPALTIDESWYVETSSSGIDVVGIDEIQFFDDDIAKYVRHLSDTWGKHVIVSGLDMTYRREPFGALPRLLAIADSITKLSAVCHKCGEDAIYTQRLIDGEPAPMDSPTIQVGGLESYEARCRKCFQSAP